MTADLAGKLQDMIDRHEIWQVLQRYGRGLDRMDDQLVRSCYWPDAIEDHGPFVGPVEDFIEWANASSRHYVAHHHGVMNHHCELDGNDAYTETYFQFVGVFEHSPHLMSMGRYVDHFQRRKAEWKIASRVTVIERNFSLEESPIGATDDPDAIRSVRDRSDISYDRPARPRCRI